MPPKRVTRSTPASTAPEASPTRRRRVRGGQGPAVAAVADEPVRGMVTRTRAAAATAKPSSSAPAAIAVPTEDRGSLTKDPVARKGPPRNSAQSDVYIPSDRGRDEESDDDDDQEDDDQQDGDQEDDYREDDDHDDHDDREDDDRAEDARAQERETEAAAHIEVEDAPFMCQGIQKLADAAVAIFAKYKDLFTKHRGILAKDVLSDEDKAQLQLYKTQLRFFEMDVDALASMRNHLIVHDSYAPFLHWLWLDHQMSGDEARVLKVALIPTNLATLVEIIYAGAKNDLTAAGKADEHAIDALAIVNDNFEDLFLGGRVLPLTTAMVDLALDVRQAYLLAALSHARKNFEARGMVYQIFCVALEKPSEAQMKASLEDGPYRPVAGLDNELVQQRCRTRVAGFLRYISGNDAVFANLAAHRGRLPAQDLLAAIQAVYDDELSKPIRRAREAWARLQDPAAAAHATGNDAASEQAEDDLVFHDATDELPPGGSDSESEEEEESQPITRVTDTQAGPVLFEDPADLRVLQELQPSSPPTLNQQASGRTLAVDHAAAPLASPSPLRRPATRRKRTRSQVGGDENDDDDPFETDTRAVNQDAVQEKRRRHEAKEAERLARAVAEQQQQNMPFPEATCPMSTSITAVGRLTQQSNPATSQIHNTTTTTVARPPRPALPIIGGGGGSSIRRRVPWSDHDEQVLIASVARHWGKWSLMEREDRDRFEHPRDQQAYRDKARLLKTKMLLGDRPLPAGFDFVALGPKERREVVRAGKNPERLESHVNLATGAVTNTELGPGQAL